MLRTFIYHHKEAVSGFRWFMLTLSVLENFEFREQKFAFPIFLGQEFFSRLQQLLVFREFIFQIFDFLFMFEIQLLRMVIQKLILLLQLLMFLEI